MHGRSTQALLTLFLFLFVSGPIAVGQDCAISADCDACMCDSPLQACDALGCGSCSCSHQSCWTRPTLTGDWLGLRSHLKDSGVIFRGNSTHFAFGVSGGINVPVPAPFGQGDTFKYTGRGEYDWIFDLEKFGGMPKGKLLVGLQHWYGEFGNVSLTAARLLHPYSRRSASDAGQPGRSLRDGFSIQPSRCRKS